MNPMREIRIEKIVLNYGAGTEGDPKKAVKILKQLTGLKPTITKTHKRTTFNVPKNKPIGCMVTIRKNCEDLLKRLLEAKEFVLKKENFDNSGNFSFGIQEYILIPEMDYEPDVGIIGFDVCVRLERRGYRVARKRLKSKIGKKHKITKQEAIEFVQKRFKVSVE